MKGINHNKTNGTDISIDLIKQQMATRERLETAKKKNDEDEIRKLEFTLTTLSKSIKEDAVKSLWF